MSEGRGASIRACTRPTTRSSQAQAAAHDPPLLIPSRRRLHCRRRPSSRDRSLLDQSLSREVPRGGGTALRRFEARALEANREADAPSNTNKEDLSKAALPRPTLRPRFEPHVSTATRGVDSRRHTHMHHESRECPPPL